MDAFNSLRIYTLLADAYELPLSFWSINRTTRHVESRRVAGIMDTATQSITQSPAAPTYQQPVLQHRLPINNRYTHSMAQRLSVQPRAAQLIQIFAVYVKHENRSPPLLKPASGCNLQPAKKSNVYSTPHRSNMNLNVIHPLIIQVLFM
jgi:hypothetical protein